MNDQAPIARLIPDRIGGRSGWWKRWETILLAVAAAIFLFNSLASPFFLNPWNLSDATFNFTEKAIIAFAMALLIVAGEIDLSVASIIAIASTAMGAAATAGAGTPVLVVIGLAVGLIAGAFNGFIVTRFQIPSIVVTIGTMSLFRGIAAILLTSRIGSTRPTIATGYELEVVTMVVLGGVNILGGSGTIPGVVIAAFVMGLVTFGFGLLNVPGIVQSIFIGSLLIGVIALPIVAGRIARRWRAA